MKRTKKSTQVSMFEAPVAEAVKSAPVVRDLTAEAERLLANFEVLAEAPGGVKRLREVVLALGVRGKLVAQDATEESASAAISRLPHQSAPARFDSRSSAQIQGVNALSVGLTHHQIPHGWVCVPLVKIARLESGHTPSRSHPEWWNGEVSWVGIVDARLHDGKTIFETRQHTNEDGLANSAARLLPTGTVCVTRTASVGYVVILGKPMATSQDFVNWVPSSAITSDWLRLVFTAEKVGFDRFSKGAVHQTIYYPEWLSMHTLLPPLAEQKRIVAKVDELMKLCDELEARQAKERETGARLTKAALDALANAEGPEEVAASWQRVVGNFEGLISRAEDVKKVRETVLELAVRGGLVQYDARDGTGASLLRTIEGELTANGVTPKPLDMPKEYPFAIPANWSWTQWGKLTLHSEAGWSPQCENRPRERMEWGVLKVSAVSWDIFDAEENKALPIGVVPRTDCAVTKGDFLMSRANTADLVGRSVIVEQDHAQLLLSDKIIRFRFSNNVELRFVNYFNRTMAARSHYKQNASGTSDSMKNISRDVILSMPIPLPPLAEQKRIVAKVDQLMALCDELESKLRQTEETSRKVAEALVAELVQPKSMDG